MSHTPGSGGGNWTLAYGGGGVALPGQYYISTGGVGGGGGVGWKASSTKEESDKENGTVTEVEFLQDQINNLVSKVANLEELASRQIDQINDLYQLIEEYRKNSYGQKGYQVAGLVASGYHAEKSW